MTNFEQKVDRLFRLQSGISRDELSRIAAFIEKRRSQIEGNAPVQTLPADEIGTSFPVRFNREAEEFDIFLDKGRPFGEGRARITVRSLQYNREEVVAVKIIESKQKELIDHFKKDRDNLVKLSKGPHIVPIYSALEFEVDGYQHLEMAQKFYNQGSLREFLKSPLLNYRRALAIACQILEAVAWIHRQGYFLHDPGPSNFLIHLEGGKVKLGIGDLELLTPLSEIDPHTFVWHALGGYEPPEGLKQALGLIEMEAMTPKLWQKTDMWGIGCTLWELFSDRPLPFKSDDFFDVDAQLALTTTEIDEPEDADSIEHLIWELLKEDPSERPDAEEALKKLRLK